MTITSAKDLETWLDAHRRPYSDIVELTGGTANFVFRVTDPRSHDTYIVKHAEPYIRSAQNVSFPVERMDFEARALDTIRSHLPPDDVVNPAKLLQYDEGEHVLVMTDGGANNLKTAYTDPSVDIELYGDRLGRWLANLHSRTGDVDVGDNAIAKGIYRWSYNHLSEALGKFGFDSSLGSRVDNEFGSRLATDDDCVCHGDFWPGNVMVGADGKLTIVDWEMTRRGTGATDVGQFAAEAWLLDTFRGNRGLLPAFLRGYVEGRGGKPSQEFARRCVAHWATHITFWPTTVEWTDHQGTKNMVDLGRKTLLQVLDDDWQLLRQGSLGLLIP